MKKFYAALTAAAIMTACFSTSAFAAPLKIMTWASLPLTQALPSLPA